MTDKQRETALKKLQEGAHFHSSSDMNADMSTEAADMVVLAVDKYIPTQNWEVSDSLLYFFPPIPAHQSTIRRSRHHYGQCCRCLALAGNSIRSIVGWTLFMWTQAKCEKSQRHAARMIYMLSHISY